MSLCRDCIVLRFLELDGADLGVARFLPLVELDPQRLLVLVAQLGASLLVVAALRRLAQSLQLHLSFALLQHFRQHQRALPTNLPNAD